MKIGICDGSPEYSKKIYEICNEILFRWKYYCEFAIYNDGIALYEEIDKLNLIILEIEMPGIDGIEIKDRLEKIKANVPIIFVSFHTERMPSAFGRNVCGFVDKAKMEYQLEACFIRVMNSLACYIILENGIDSRLVHYIKSERSYSDLYLVSGEKVITRTSLHEYEKLLCRVGFIRTHKSYLINMYHIEMIKNNQFIVGNQIIPISVRLQKKVISNFNMFKSARFNENLLLYKLR